MDQGTPIIDRKNLDAFGERLLDLLNFFLYPVDALETILAVAHHHNPADGFALPVQFRVSPPQVWTEMNVPHLLQINWSAVLNLQDDVIEIFQTLDVTATSDKKFGRRDFECFAADILVTHPDRVDDISDRDVIGGQLVRIAIDLVLLNEAAYWRDLSHAFDRFKGVSDIPILEGA